MQTNCSNLLSLYFCILELWVSLCDYIVSRPTGSPCLLLAFSKAEAGSNFQMKASSPKIHFYERMTLQCLPFTWLFYSSSKCEWKMSICFRASHASALMAQWFLLPRRGKKWEKKKKEKTTGHWIKVESKASLTCPEHGIKLKINLIVIF